MFSYQGQIQGFTETLEEHGDRLGRIYRDALKAQALDNIVRLVTPRLYYTHPREQSLVKSITHVAEDLIKQSRHPEFLAQSFALGLLEEQCVEELDRRILQQLGYNPLPWLEARRAKDEATDEYLRELVTSRHKFLRTMDWTRFLRFIENWDSAIAQDNRTLANLVRSYQNYRIIKIRTEEVTGLEDMMSSSTIIGIGADKDNFYTTILVSPEQDKIEISDNGNLFLKNGSKIVTAPLIILPEDGVQEVTAKQLEGSTLPPYLVAFVHEFNHFLVYALQRYPLNLTTSLFFLKGTRQN